MYGDEYGQNIATEILANLGVQPMQSETEQEAPKPT